MRTMDRVMKITQRQCLLALMSSVIVVVCVFIGITMNLTTLYDENFDHMGIRTFCMFTVNSNILAAAGMAEMRARNMLTLSGGEQQRVFLAQVFAQDPELLILDEPANHLDLKYQQHIFSLIRDWLKEPGRAVLSVVHDLSLARKYGTHAILLDHGKTVSRGLIDDVMTPENLKQVYGMDVYAWMKDMLSQWQ